jgi:hypothetical protein
MKISYGWAHMARIHSFDHACSGICPIECASEWILGNRNPKPFWACGSQFMDIRRS